MLSTTPIKRRLAALAAICLLGVAAVPTPAMAQKTKTKPAPVAEASVPDPAPVFTVEIASIEAVDSNVDEPTLRAIFSGNLVDNAQALAGLTATSITIPLITLTAQVTTDGHATDSTVTWNDIVLTNVVDGVAESATMSGASLATDQDISGQLGAVSANQVDIGGMLALYGLVDSAGQTEMSTLYTDFSFAGGAFEAPELSCTFGGASTSEFKARPMTGTFAEMTALFEELGSQSEDPSPQTVGKALRLYADMITAFEYAPMQFDGFDCSGTDEQDNAVAVSVASMTVGPMTPGIYPEVDIKGMEFLVDGDGAVSIGTLHFKSIDLSGPLAAIKAAPDAIGTEWFMENSRALIPAFAGFSIGDVAIDVPDPDDAEGRIVASIGSFDLSLADYFNGIPTAINTSASHMMLELPASSPDEQLQMLMALGVTSIDAGFTIDASWDQATSAITLNQVSVTGADLATIALAGTINNATEALFSSDENMMMAASMGLALGSLKLDVEDAGLSDIILTMVAADQGSDAATLRPVFAGLAEGTVISMLAGAAQAQKIGTAVSAFVGGKSSKLSLEVTARQQPGLGMLDFMAAEDDPALLLDKVDIEASN